MYKGEENVPISYKILPTMWRNSTGCVPLVTEPGISVIIVTSMKISQQNLNRSTFVVWEIKMNVFVVCVCFVAISLLVLELLKKCRVR
jgi:hypothetical protein